MRILNIFLPRRTWSFTEVKMIFISKTPYSSVVSILMLAHMVSITDSYGGVKGRPSNY